MVAKTVSMLAGSHAVGPHCTGSHYILLHYTQAPILWPPNMKSWLIGKDSNAGKDWRQEEKGMTEDEMGRWDHRLNGYEFDQIPGDMKEREAWRAAVHGVAKSRTQLSNWTTTYKGEKRQFHLFCFVLFCFWLHFVLCKILVPWPGIKTMLLALEFRSLNHWTATEVPKIISFKNALSGQ